jgi:hypothetical protein
MLFYKSTSVSKFLLKNITGYKKNHLTTKMLLPSPVCLEESILATSCFGQKQVGKAKKANITAYPEGEYAALATGNENCFWNQTFDKSRLKNFVLWFLIKHGEHKTVQLVEELKNIGFEYATKAGISLGIEDLKIPTKKYALMMEAEELSISTIKQYKRNEITGVERFQRLIETWHKTSERLKQEVIENFEATDILNPVYMMAFSGARGNISQVRQLVGMRGLMSNPNGQIIDFPIRSNFREGLTLTEYIISSYGARKGIVDTALRTANAGYLTRRLVDVAQHVIISSFDCQTKRGIFLTDMKEGNKIIYSIQNRLIGRVLARDIFAPKQNKKIALRNTEISLELANLIGQNIKKVFVRSSLTCETKKLVCQLCYGWSLAQGNLVSIGEAVGVVAAQSIGEPGTQLTMRTFHTGGVFSGDITDQIKASFNGIVLYPNPIAGTLIRTPEGKIAFLTKNEGSFLLQTQVSSNLGSHKDLLTPSALAPQPKGENAGGKLRKLLQPISTNKIEIKKYKIPSYTLLFLKNGETVLEKEVMAQISYINRQQIATDYAELTIKSELSGQFYSKVLNLKENKVGPKLKTQEKSGFDFIESEEGSYPLLRCRNEAPSESLRRRGGEQQFNEKAVDTIFESWGWGYAWILAGKIYQLNLPSAFFPIIGDFLNQKTYMNKIEWATPSTFTGPLKLNMNLEMENGLNQNLKHFRNPFGSSGFGLSSSKRLGVSFSNETQNLLAKQTTNTNVYKLNFLNQKNLNLLKNELVSFQLSKIIYKKVGYFLKLTDSSFKSDKNDGNRGNGNLPLFSKRESCLPATNSKEILDDKFSQSSLLSTNDILFLFTSLSLKNSKNKVFSLVQNDQISSPPEGSLNNKNKSILNPSACSAGGKLLQPVNWKKSFDIFLNWLPKRFTKNTGGLILVEPIFFEPLSKISKKYLFQEKTILIYKLNNYKTKLKDGSNRSLLVNGARFPRSTLLPSPNSGNSSSYRRSLLEEGGLATLAALGRRGVRGYFFASSESLRRPTKKASLLPNKKSVNFFPTFVKRNFLKNKMGGVPANSPPGCVLRRSLLAAAGGAASKNNSDLTRNLIFEQYNKKDFGTLLYTSENIQKHKSKLELLTFGLPWKNSFQINYNSFLERNEQRTSGASLLLRDSDGKTFHSLPSENNIRNTVNLKRLVFSFKYNLNFKFVNNVAKTTCLKRLFWLDQPFYNFSSAKNKNIYFSKPLYSPRRLLLAPQFGASLNKELLQRDSESMPQPEDKTAYFKETPKTRRNKTPSKINKLDSINEFYLNNNESILFQINRQGQIKNFKGSAFRRNEGGESAALRRNKPVEGYININHKNSLFKLKSFKEKRIQDNDKEDAKILVSKNQQIEVKENQYETKSFAPRRLLLRSPEGSTLVPFLLQRDYNKLFYKINKIIIKNSLFQFISFNKNILDVLKKRKYNLPSFLISSKKENNLNLKIFSKITSFPYFLINKTNKFLKKSLSALSTNYHSYNKLTSSFRRGKLPTPQTKESIHKYRERTSIVATSPPSEQRRGVKQKSLFNYYFYSLLNKNNKKSIDSLYPVSEINNKLKFWKVFCCKARTKKNTVLVKIKKKIIFLNKNPQTHITRKQIKIKNQVYSKKNQTFSNSNAQILQASIYNSLKKKQITNICSPYLKDQLKYFFSLEKDNKEFSNSFILNVRKCFVASSSYPEGSCYAALPFFVPTVRLAPLGRGSRSLLQNGAASNKLRELDLGTKPFGEYAVRKQRTNLLSPSEIVGSQLNIFYDHGAASPPSSNRLVFVPKKPRTASKQLQEQEQEEEFPSCIKSNIKNLAKNQKNKVLSFSTTFGRDSQNFTDSDFYQTFLVNSNFSERKNKLKSWIKKSTFFKYKYFLNYFNLKKQFKQISYIGINKRKENTNLLASFDNFASSRDLPPKSFVKRNNRFQIKKSKKIKNKESITSFRSEATQKISKTKTEKSLLTGGRSLLINGGSFPLLPFTNLMNKYNKSKNLKKTSFLFSEGNLLVKPGWLYYTDNLSDIFFYNQKLINCGKNIGGQLVFDNQSVYIEIIKLNKETLFLSKQKIINRILTLDSFFTPKACYAGPYLLEEGQDANRRQNNLFEVDYSDTLKYLINIPLNFINTIKNNNCRFKITKSSLKCKSFPTNKKHFILIRKSSEYKLFKELDYKKELYKISNNKKNNIFLSSISFLQSQELLKKNLELEIDSSSKALTPSSLSERSAVGVSLKKGRSTQPGGEYAAGNCLLVSERPHPKGEEQEGMQSDCNKILKKGKFINQSFNSINLTKLYKTNQLNKQKITNQTLSKYPAAELKVILNSDLYSFIDKFNPNFSSNLTNLKLNLFLASGQNKPSYRDFTKLTSSFFQNEEGAADHRSKPYRRSLLEEGEGCGAGAAVLSILEEKKGCFKETPRARYAAPILNKINSIYRPYFKLTSVKSLNLSPLIITYKAPYSLDFPFKTPTCMFSEQLNLKSILKLNKMSFEKKQYNSSDVICSLLRAADSPPSLSERSAVGTKKGRKAEDDKAKNKKMFDFKKILSIYFLKIKTIQRNRFYSKSLKINLLDEINKKEKVYPFVSFTKIMKNNDSLINLHNIYYIAKSRSIFSFLFSAPIVDYSLNQNVDKSIFHPNILVPIRTKCIPRTLFSDLNNIYNKKYLSKLNRPILGSINEGSLSQVNPQYEINNEVLIYNSNFSTFQNNEISSSLPFIKTYSYSSFEGELIYKNSNIVQNKPASPSSFRRLFVFRSKKGRALLRSDGGARATQTKGKFYPNISKEEEGLFRKEKEEMSLLSESLCVRAAEQALLSKPNKKNQKTNLINKTKEISLNGVKQKDNAPQNNLFQTNNLDNSCMILTKSDQIAFSLPLLNYKETFFYLENLKKKNQYFINNIIIRFLNNTENTFQNSLEPEPNKSLKNNENTNEISQNMFLSGSVPAEQAEGVRSGCLNQSNNKEVLVKLNKLPSGLAQQTNKLVLGNFLVYGDQISPNLAVEKSGQIIHLNNQKITIRKGQPIFISPKAILYKYDGDFIDEQSSVITLAYQQLKTGDIIQGIPKVEQFFEARTTKRGRLFRDSLSNLLKALFKRYRAKLPLDQAVRQSFYKIQQIIIDGVHRVYRSQGVSITDKHLEVIVKQMTSKVRIIEGGQTGFFPGEIVEVNFVEEVNRLLMKKISYEPLVLGITKASLEVDSFLSAASFQQTTKVLSRSALSKKKDFLKGLKENVILGNLIPAGTGYLVYLDQI